MILILQIAVGITLAHLISWSVSVLHVAIVKTVRERNTKIK